VKRVVEKAKNRSDWTKKLKAGSTIAYTGIGGAAAFTVQVPYTLTGQDPGAGRAHLHAAIDVTRIGGLPPTIDLYQYSNVDLGDPGPGTEAMIRPQAVRPGRADLR
jgi:hypothetical protein